MELFIIIGGTAIVSGFLGYYIRFLITLAKKNSLELDLKQKILEAKEEATKIIVEAKEKAEEIEIEQKNRIEEKEKTLQSTENRLIKKEAFLDARQTELDKEAEHQKSQIEEIREIKEKANNLLSERTELLQSIAHLTKEEAKDLVLKEIEKSEEKSLISLQQKLERENNSILERRAKDILATTIHRLATTSVSEFMTTTVNIPSEEIKGKIIGKEGRNIRTFERESGVELIIDDTPGTIVISSFDPVRREIARIALEKLITDGRIQPAKIEEMVERAKTEVKNIIKKEGEKAVFECGIFNLDPEVIKILGRLHFRTSYGQNVLAHSIEMAHIAGMLAHELGADVSIAKSAALVHDIGKALDHEVEGTHIQIGMRILEKYGTDKRIITAMKSHHDDWPHESIEAVIIQTADYISGGRPGARRDTVESYIKRLNDLEQIAKNTEGVEKAFALQAGRELRIFVNAEEVNDFETKKIARKIAENIEKDLKYPGEIKVTVIRENRIIEYAR